ncbi:metal-dependent hydrolase [Neokomagataea anthophila]|uniref:Metal-dependent hydrolase n=1 Tax=Neokomagataea anthophila TaxID=2826925 RepID=A0ABS5E3U5_9PROT|nr:metal-dependent hydrolase [Neokomagataea anthophila]MBR0558573.1 metal-dependent hydrolase [Neokomagataea anthophila]
MTGRSHLLVGAFTSFCAMRWHILTPDIVSFFTALIGSLLPDIDTERSMMGARMKWLSRPIARMCGHRGLTHSAVFWVAVSVLCRVLFGEDVLAGPLGALLLGVASHICVDLPTGGCQLFGPLSRSRVSVWPYVKTGGVGEVCLLVPTLALLGWCGWNAMPIHLGHDLHRPAHQRLHVPFSGDMALPS